MTFVTIELFAERVIVNKFKLTSLSPFSLEDTFPERLRYKWKIIQALTTPMFNE